ncbi:MAG TPA: hypothetical protein VFF16_18050 [Telluria sp.]|nr:hypothetical protein [Telluria sp.]
MPVYVQHQVLGNIDDVFDADAIWQAPGLALFHRRPLLRDLLERSPREQRGRAPTRCFTHVAIQLPQEDLDDDRHLTRGARARELAESLKALHQKDFGDLLGQDEVRYGVTGTDELQSGQIEVRFGHAVYLPAPDEPILQTVTASVDGTNWRPVCAVHQNERLVVLGDPGGMVSHGIADWPFGPDAALVLLNDGPDSVPELQVRPRQALDCAYDPLNACHTVRQRGGPARLFVRVHRTGQAKAAAPAAVWKTRTRSTEPDATAVPPAAQESEATYAPAAHQRATLAALALPRLSRYGDTGATEFELALDAFLRPAAGADASVRLRIRRDDSIQALTHEAEQTLTLPARITPAPGRSLALEAVPAPLAERYCALLPLPAPSSAPVTAGAPLAFGRTAPGLAALRLPAGAAVLKQEGTAGGSADRLGLSRQAFRAEATTEGFRIVRLSANQALFHLDPALRFVAAIEHADPDQPYLLPSGHHLVAGHYVLRLDA